MKKLLVLLFTLVVLCLSACRQPTGAAYGGHPAGNPAMPPALHGYGKISVRISDTPRTARTITPSMAFDSYTYTFTAEGKPPTEKAPDKDGFFTLEVGEYTVAVKAYIEVEGVAALAASGVSGAFTVAEGDNQAVVVALAAVAAGAGEFSYIVTYPPDAIGEIALYSYPGMVDIGLSPSHVREVNGLTEWLELEAGTYLLTVSVKMGGRYAGITEAIHIAPFLATYYDRDFVEEDFTGTIPSITGGIKFVCFWLDEHGELLTTSNGTLHNGETAIAVNETLAITAQGAGYTVKQWHLNGVPAQQGATGDSGNTYFFTSEIPGKYTVGLLVEKNGKLYNSNIAITVEGTAEPQGGEPSPPQGGHVTRTVTVDMYDLLGDGWNGNGALKINVNGITIANNVNVAITNSQNIPKGQRHTNTYTFPVKTGDVVQFYWVAGNSQGDISFIVYYTDTPPIPAFTNDNKGATSWNGTNALLYRIRGYASDGLVSVADGTLLGSFTVE